MVFSESVALGSLGAETTLKTLCARVREGFDVLVGMADTDESAFNRVLLPEASFKPQHFLYFLPEPHGQGSLRLILLIDVTSLSFTTGM